jgi:WD40 repeat protein
MDFISTLYVLHGGRFCIGYSNGKIKIFNSTTFEYEMELLGHKGWVYDIIQLSDGILCSASKDKTIKLWNLSSGECEATLVGHEHWVTTVLLYSSTQLCSGSYDQTIRLWNIESGVCEATIINACCNRNAIAYLELLPNGLVASLTLGGYLTILNMETRDVSKICSIDRDSQYNNKSGFCMIQLASGDLCISVNKDDNGEIIILDFKTHQKIKTMIPIRHTNYYVNIKTMLLLRDGRLAVGIHSYDVANSDSESDEDVNNEYATILIYNIYSGECEQELRDTEANHMVQLSDGRLCSSGHKYFSVW